MRSLTRSACIFLLAWGAFAQSDRGTITGTISDPAGAMVAGAAIEAKNQATGVTYQAASTATGNRAKRLLQFHPWSQSLSNTFFQFCVPKPAIDATSVLCQ